MNRLFFETAKQFELEGKKTNNNTAEQMAEIKYLLAKLKYYNAITKKEN